MLLVFVVVAPLAAAVVVVVVTLARFSWLLGGHEIGNLDNCLILLLLRLMINLVALGLDDVQ